METLAEAKAFVEARRRSGTRCPCCERLVKVYRRPLNAEMGTFLIKLTRMAPERDGYVSIKTVPNVRGGDYAKSKFYGFIESQEKDPSETYKATSGRWRITDTGLSFVMNELTVPSHVFVLDNKFIGFDERKKIGIVQALGKRFNYAELMNG